MKGKLFLFIVFPMVSLTLHSCNGSGSAPRATSPRSVNICESGKLRALTLKYTGLSCRATSHRQRTDMVNCEGDPARAAMVRIVASDRLDLQYRKVKIWFDGIVELNGTFTIDAANAGEAGLSSRTFVTIFKMDGTVLQTTSFQTSCSEPLRLGDQFGSLSLVGSTQK